MIVQSQPIPINQGREFQSNRRRHNRFSVQRMRNQNYKYPLPPQESPPQYPELPLGDFQGLPTCPPNQQLADGFYAGPAFPTGPHVLDNVTAFMQQDQCVDLRDETLSPPVGFSASSMRGFAGSPPYPMPLRIGFSPPFSGQPSYEILNSTPPAQYENPGERQVTYQQQMYTSQFQAYLPVNQYSPPLPLAFFPSPPGMPNVPCGYYSPPPPSQPQESFAAPLFNPMPMPYFVDPSCLGATQDEDPPVMSANEASKYLQNYSETSFAYEFEFIIKEVYFFKQDSIHINTGSHWVKKCWTRGKGAKVQSNNQCRKTTEQGNGRLETRQRSTSAPAISSPVCSFCKRNRETREFYQSHVLKNDDGVTTCPVLRKYTCPICKAVGDNAHTLKYCPENEDGVMSSRGRSMSLSRKSELKKKRNSRGIIGAYRYG